MGRMKSDAKQFDCLFDPIYYLQQRIGLGETEIGALTGEK